MSPRHRDSDLSLSAAASGMPVGACGSKMVGGNFVRCSLASGGPAEAGGNNRLRVSRDSQVRAFI
eukprot:4967010-Pyramimonas_sp.AAC.1